MRSRHLHLMSGCVFNFLFFLLICAGLAHAQLARIEVHPFESMTLTDQQILTGRKDGNPVIVAGELRIPRPGTSRLPGVILVHGSGGLSGYVDDWSHQLNAMGVSTFLLDSFTGRGLTSVAEDQSLLGRLAMVIDVYRALELLVKHPRIDPERIAVMGFSRGGQAALYSSLKRLYRMHGPAGGAGFVAYIVLYPNCGTVYVNDVEIADEPVRIFHGSADDWNPVAPCRAYVERLRASGKDVQLTEYANAHHVFDWARLKKPLKLPKAQNFSQCQLEEAADGVIVNGQTGQPFTYGDACVARGATVAYNAEAHDEVLRAVKEFIGATLKPK